GGNGPGGRGGNIGGDVGDTALAGTFWAIVFRLYRRHSRILSVQQSCKNFRIGGDEGIEKGAAAARAVKAQSRPGSLPDAGRKKNRTGNTKKIRQKFKIEIGGNSQK